MVLCLLVDDDFGVVVLLRLFAFQCWELRFTEIMVIVDSDAPA